MNVKGSIKWVGSCLSLLVLVIVSCELVFDYISTSLFINLISLGISNKSTNIIGFLISNIPSKNIASLLSITPIEPLSWKIANLYLIEFPWYPINVSLIVLGF